MTKRVSPSRREIPKEILGMALQYAEAVERRGGDFERAFWFSVYENLKAQKKAEKKAEKNKSEK